MKLKDLAVSQEPVPAENCQKLGRIYCSWSSLEELTCRLQDPVTDKLGESVSDNPLL